MHNEPPLNQVHSGVGINQTNQSKKPDWDWLNFEIECFIEISWEETIHHNGHQTMHELIIDSNCNKNVETP